MAKTPSNRISPGSVAFYLTKQYFKKSSYLKSFVSINKSHYLFHIGYPKIRISNHRLHHRQEKEKVINIEIIEDEVFINNKLVIIDKDRSKGSAMQRIRDQFELEINLYWLEYNYSALSKITRFRKKRPLYFKKR